MAIDRREFLGALALAPAALAACSGPSAGAAHAVRGGGAASTVPPASAAGADPRAPLAAVRSFPLAAGVEPAFVFRAAAVRPGER